MAQNDMATFWVAIQRLGIGTSSMINWVLDAEGLSRPVGTSNWYLDHNPVTSTEHSCGALSYKVITLALLTAPASDHTGKYWMAPCSKPMPSICQLPNNGACTSVV